MSNPAFKQPATRRLSKAQWAKAKADAIYAEIKAIRDQPCKDDVDYRRKRDSIKVLEREASRFMSISFYYEQRGQ